jgi:hypothetical protein
VRASAGSAAAPGGDYQNRPSSQAKPQRDLLASSLTDADVARAFLDQAELQLVVERSNGVSFAKGAVFETLMYRLVRDASL